ncbi:hypothetical protein EDD73_105137 [Heliophilum fasciatum]|uniref:Uncharacterized protein n=1 Tax=Heliophilum fasciatum TaxID=35700 RepID=A0A4R2RSJ6_9FIRM|nr:hypothetical protein [Heliophilum fasciatum]TCP67242.1 hypothetical protein EDD73_105137 [Heliophilum fasciatum]
MAVVLPPWDVRRHIGICTWLPSRYLWSAVHLLMGFPPLPYRSAHFCLFFFIVSGYPSPALAGFRSGQADRFRLMLIRPPSCERSCIFRPLFCRKEPSIAFAARQQWLSLCLPQLQPVDALPQSGSGQLPGDAQNIQKHFRSSRASQHRFTTPNGTASFTHNLITYILYRGLFSFFWHLLIWGFYPDSSREVSSCMSMP